jgi:hypothetical protein
MSISGYAGALRVDAREQIGGLRLWKMSMNVLAVEPHVWTLPRTRPCLMALHSRKRDMLVT